MPCSRNTQNIVVHVCCVFSGSFKGVSCWLLVPFDVAIWPYVLNLYVCVKVPSFIYLFIYLFIRLQPFQSFIKNDTLFTCPSYEMHTSSFSFFPTPIFDTPDPTSSLYVAN